MPITLKVANFRRMRLKHTILKGSLAALVIFSVLVVGCERRKARDRVIAAINPPEVVVTNGQAAALKVGNGYALIIPWKDKPTEAEYRVIFASSPDFTTAATVITQGVARGTTPVDVRGTTVYLGFGGRKATVVRLDFGDSNTAIGLCSETNLAAIDVSKVAFAKGKSLQAEDLAKSIGIGQ